jgi:uncharacterized membrane protein HdeD (DUF308 family)
MLFDRIIGAFEFRRSVYREVEHDESFTRTAWILVVLSAFLNQLGSHASRDSTNWLIAAIIGTITAVIGFALAAFIIDRVGRGLFGAKVNFGQLVRTLGLAYIWSAVGVIGLVATFFSGLSCIVGPVLIVATILLVIAWFVAAKEALDLAWGRTIATVLLGWIVLVAILIGTRVVLALLGIGAAAPGGLIGF